MNKTQKFNQVQWKYVVYIGVCAGKKNSQKTIGFFVEDWRTVLCVCEFGSDYINCRKIYQQSSEGKVLVHG